MPPIATSNFRIRATCLPSLWQPDEFVEPSHYTFAVCLSSASLQLTCTYCISWHVATPSTIPDIASYLNFVSPTPRTAKDQGAGHGLPRYRP